MSRSSPGGVRYGILAFALLAVAVVALPSVAAQGNQTGNETESTDGNVVSFTVVGLEGDACEETFCFDVPVKALSPNATVDITFENPTDNTQHSFYVLEDGDTTGGAKPDPGDALAGVDTIPGGESESTGAFELPDSEGSLYLWCNEPGHAEGGMWEFVGLGAAAGGGEGGGEVVAQQVGVPLFSYWVGVIAVFAMFAWLAATFFVLRYQSSHHTDHRDREKD